MNHFLTVLSVIGFLWNFPFILMCFASFYLFLPIAFTGISEIKTRKGLALVDIVREVTLWVLFLILYDFRVMIFAWLSPLFNLCRFVFKIEMPSNIRVQLINDLADIEYASISLMQFIVMFYYFILLKYVWSAKYGPHHQLDKRRTILIFWRWCPPYAFHPICYSTISKSKGLKTWGFFFFFFPLLWVWMGRELNKLKSFLTYQ